MLEEIAHPKDIEILAQRIVSSVPRALIDVAPGVSSVGIALRRTGQERPVEMLRRADMALLIAKGTGRGRFELIA